jgi:hypothetical protein
VKPLTRLTEKNTAYIWTEDCKKAFDTLREKLIEGVGLAYPDPEIHFILDCDASQFGLGAVLSQIVEGTERVVSYFA